MAPPAASDAEPGMKTPPAKEPTPLPLLPSAASFADDALPLPLPLPLKPPSSFAAAPRANAALSHCPLSRRLPGALPALLPGALPLTAAAAAAPLPALRLAVIALPDDATGKGAPEAEAAAVAGRGGLAAPAVEVPAVLAEA